MTNQSHPPRHRSKVPVHGGLAGLRGGNEINEINEITAIDTGTTERGGKWQMRGKGAAGMDCTPGGGLFRNHSSSGGDGNSSQHEIVVIIPTGNPPTWQLHRRHGTASFSFGGITSPVGRSLSSGVRTSSHLRNYVDHQCMTEILCFLRLFWCLLIEYYRQGIFTIRRPRCDLSYTQNLTILEQHTC